MFQFTLFKSNEIFKFYIKWILQKKNKKTKYLVTYTTYVCVYLKLTLNAYETNWNQNKSWIWNGSNQFYNNLCITQ